jgi:protein-disulfide isomerase-like protein with CxxC motif
VNRCKTIERFSRTLWTLAPATLAARPATDRLAAFRALHSAFYAEGRDAIDDHVPTDIAVNILRAMNVATNVDEHFQIWASAEKKGETQQDFILARALSVASFPTLLLKENN